jgi:hypothetical protein
MPTPARTAPNPQAPVDHAQVLVAIPRGDAEELRVSLDEYEEHPFVSIRVWAQGRDGQWWPVRGKGVTVRVRELGQVINALGRAAKETGQAPRPTGAAKGVHNPDAPLIDPRPELPDLADARDLASGDAALDVF